MQLSGPSSVVLTNPSIREVVADAGAPELSLVGPDGVRPHLVKGLVDAGRTVLVTTATVREAEDLIDSICDVVDPDLVALYPAWETLPHERLSPRSDTVGRRLAVLRRLVHPVDSPGATDGHAGPATGPVKVVVAPIRSVLQPQVKGLADLEPVALRSGQEVEIEEVTRRLADAAYQRVDLVEKRGEFAVRGGIIDVFPPTEEHPLRIEFFGDEVDEIRSFAVADQRTIEVVTRVWAPPCRELLLTPDVRRRAAELGARRPELRELTDKIAEGIATEGMEALTPVLVDELELLVDLMPADTHVLALDPERIRARAHDLVATSEEFLGASWASAAAGGQAPIDLGAGSLRTLAEVRSAVRENDQAWWSIGPFGIDSETDPDARVIAAEAVTPYRGDIEAAVADITRWVATRPVVVVHPGQGPADRLVEVLGEHDVPARFEQDVTPRTDGVVTVTRGLLSAGLITDEIVILTGEDISGQAASTRDMRAMPTRRKKQIDPLELKAGDYVVHEQHGVGRFLEMQQREVGGAVREFLVLEYAPSKKGFPPDRLMVPADTLDQVTRYVGGESPSLDRMGGGDWAKRKGRAKKAVRQIAAELIKLYAARQATKGHAYGPDSPWQRELEDAFPFHETPDQLTTVDEVKGDMQQVVPMDRLVCGDVGYGKTEIAVRAAFKAVQDGKQVAVLVPTTLLVTQHLSTFEERMSGFPVVLKPLSRFQTDKEAKEVIAGLEDGSVDIVIGTHRLLNPDIKLKDLGLIIVDEEQRFGVEHKEQMKRMRTSVDVLSMSATPIPRTLEMAITGIREMSTITTPPEERHPVLTYVGAYDDRQVTAAVRRELLRDGQVFYIHNRVNSIEKAAARIKELVPEARVATAHGQMGEHQLEQVMLDFWEKRFDVLVCTTIVESGLDVSNANTMIIERADTLGLSQLHQLRGRVGRSRERAYAYFLYPGEKPLTETAHERLATLAQHSDLGGGMAIAMKDLEIRGAGNLLGGEQSGHIADVGFDLYVRLVGEAVAEFRNDGAAPEKLIEVKIELPVDAHVPHDYITSERLRLEMYKRLAEVTGEDDIIGIREEMLDRYGPLPEPVERLLGVAVLRTQLRAVGVSEVAVPGKFARFAPVNLPDSRVVRLSRLYPKSLYKPATGVLLVPRPAALRDAELLEWVSQVVRSIIAPEGN